MSKEKPTKREIELMMQIAEHLKEISELKRELWEYRDTLGQLADYILSDDVSSVVFNEIKRWLG